MQQLVQIAITAAQAYERAGNSVSRQQIETLEDAINRIASADQWTVRLVAFLETVKSQTAHDALKQLVARGCVPDLLVDCLAEQREAEDSSPPARARLNAHRQQIKRLAEQMRDLANLCADEEKLLLHTGGAYFLSGHVPLSLWAEAHKIDLYLLSSDLRIAPKLLTARAEHVLMTTMADIRVITGGYHDRLFAEFLSPVFKISEEALKKFRARRAGGNMRTSGASTVLSRRLEEAKARLRDGHRPPTHSILEKRPRRNAHG